MNQSLFQLPVTIYGNFEKYNEVLSKARLRIFYKYGNRNGTYITDEFAEKLLSSVSYAPIKGIYEDSDYSDHGSNRDEGRIYGIVPENPNLAWEDHTDEDGITRTYACVDVLIFTALYKEASEIVGKSQSMELYGPSLQYHEGIIHGQKWIIFDEGCFLGLQVLGDDVEPCFEGASFYTLQSTIEFVVNQLKNYGGTKMPVINFKLSDDQKFNAIWTLLNDEYNEESGWVVSYSISAIYDDYALVRNYGDGEFYRVKYTKNDEDDSVVLGERVKVYIIDVTENEKNTLETLRALNGDTYELVNPVLENAQNIASQNEEFSAKITEMEDSISTLNTEKAELQASVSEYSETIEKANATINLLNEENASLKEYKLGIERTQKEGVINEYVGKLADDLLDQFRADIEKYTSTEELDMHLAYELKKSGSDVFEQNNDGFVPKPDIHESGISAILSKYKK